MNSSHHVARRAFLQRLGHLSVAGAAAPWALNLAAIGEAAAFNASDYKALVCVFLYGGNDHGNTLIPYDAAGHAEYAKVRAGLAIGRDALAATALAPQLAGGRQFALSPHLSALKPLFDAGRLAVQLNVGPLVVPTSLAQYQARSVPLPPKLFSHNDQQSLWQSSQPEGSVRGWGGAIGDLALSSNGNALFTCLSVSGNAVFLAGREALPYQIGASGAIAINGITRPLYSSGACSAALQTLITQPRTQVLENEYNRITARSIGAQQILSGALAGTPGFDTQLPATDPASGLAAPLNAQLRIVARLISARQTLGMKRQVFMVALGGFDTHDGLPDRHPRLLQQVGAAMAGFQDAVDSIGASASVTTFTASDFGRTLSSNGNGSDHGWGAHHFVMGGAVRGGAYYGSAPQIALGGPEDTGQGRLLPTTSVDQFAATLAGWFGATDTELPLVVPNIGNYGVRNLGFL